MTGLSEVEVVGFDLDQTLYPKSPEIDEYFRQELAKVIAEHRGWTIDEAIAAYDATYESGRGLSGSRTLAHFGVENGTDIIQHILEDERITRFLKPEQKTYDLLVWVKEIFGNIDILTGTAKERAIRKLGRLGIETSLFNYIIGGDEASKSTGEAYRLWMDLYPQYSAQQFLYVGDRAKSDYIIPASLGINCVLVYVDEPNEEYSCEQLPDLFALKDYISSRD